MSRQTRYDRITILIRRVRLATTLDELLSVCDAIRGEYRPGELMCETGLKLYAAIEKRRGELGDPQFSG